MDGTMFWLALMLLVPGAITEAGPESVAPEAATAPVAGHPFAAVLHSSEEAQTLLRRAEEGSGRGDWKLVTDSLQRMIELPGEHLLSRTGRNYTSAGRFATRMLAALPPEGLRVYRLVYDAEARALFERARRDHDEAALKAIVDEYLLTEVGDEAVLTLASWWLDVGRDAEAADVLRWLKVAGGDYDLPSWLVDARLAMALAGAGQVDRAQQLVAEALVKQGAAVPSNDDGDESSGAPGGLAEGRDRLESVYAWLESRAGAGGPPTPLAWSMAGGEADRRGRLSAVEPALLAELPWCRPLPLSVPWERTPLIAEYARTHGRIPTAQPVVGGDLFLIKVGDEVIALDRLTFEPRWRSALRAGQGWLDGDRERARRYEVLDSVDSLVKAPADHPVIVRLFGDVLGGRLSVADGRVFAIDWPDGPPAPPAMWGPEGEPILRRRAHRTGTPQTNRLVACSLATGRILWATDTAGEQRDLAQAQFLAVPIPVGDALLAPCRVGTDLYAVVLDPETGQMIQHVYLCGTGGGPFNGLWPRDPCRADGMVIIPTGRGLLIALDETDLTVRWASRYDGVARKRTSKSWYPTPVRAVADVVLLAPADADDLICFDRATGRIRWTIERDDARYVLDADDQQVWLAGREVRSYAIDEGRAIWSRSAGRVTGVGVRAGATLYVPTAEGLKAFDASSGRAWTVDASAGTGHMLGNLLAWQGELLNVTAVDVRKYPDLKQGYVRARQAYEADPTDGDAALRLAWLETLRSQPEEVLSVLATVSPVYEIQDAHRYAQMVHLRVRAMLERVRADGLTAEAALAMLRQARRIARDPTDALDATLALGEELARAGRAGEACVQYAGLILSEPGDQMLPVDRGYAYRARLRVARRLVDLQPVLDAAGGARFDTFLDDRLSAAIEQRDEAQLRWFMETPALGPSSDEAALVLARWAIAEYRYEYAESILRRVLARGPEPPAGAEAAARLATIYLQDEPLRCPGRARDAIGRLGQAPADVTLPGHALEGLAEVAGAASRWPEPRAELIRADRAAAMLTSLLEGALPEKSRETLGGARGLAGSAESYQLDEVQPIVLGHARSELLDDRFFVLAGGQQVEARRREDGELIWPAELRLLSELSVEAETNSAVVRIRRQRRASRFVNAARALLSGQTLVINDARGLHALGALTGRRLWSRPFEPPVAAGQDPTAGTAWQWVHRGYVVSVDRRGQLEVAPAEEGERPLWQRSGVTKKWHWVRARGDYVVAMDGGLGQVDVYALADGSYQGACRFIQPDTPVSVALFEDFICGPAQTHTVAAYELGTPGVERWRQAMPAELSQLFKPAAELLAVADREGRLVVLDAPTGQVRLRTRVDACPAGVTDGRLEDGVLYVCGWDRRPEGRTRGPDGQRWAVAAIGFDDGREIWKRTDLDARTHLNAKVLGADSAVIPLVSFRRDEVEAGANPPGRARGVPDGQVELVLIDKRTGRPIGPPAVARIEGDDGAGLILDVHVTAEVVYVVVGSTYLKFPCKQASSS